MKILFSLVLVLLSYTFVFGQLYTFKKFNHKTGISSSSFLSVAEDKEGYLWFGTDGAGLIKYDGLQFKEFNQYKTQSQHHVSYITVSEKNEIFFSSYYKGFLKHDDEESRTIYNLPSNLGSSSGMVEIGKSFAYFTSNAITIVDDSTIITQYNFYPKKENLEIYQTFPLGNSKFCLTSRGNFIISQNSITPLYDWLGTSKTNTENLRHGYLSGDSLIFLNKYLTKETTILLQNNLPSFFISDSIPNSKGLKASEEIEFSDRRNKESFFTTNTGKIYLRDDNVREIVNREKSIYSSNEYSDILIDFNGDVWVTTDNDGILRISKEIFTPLKIHPIYSNPYIGYISKLSNGTILLSTIQNQTYIGNIYSNSPFKQSTGRIFGNLTFNGIQYVSKENGIFKLKNLELVNSKFDFCKNKKVYIFNGNEDFFWAAVLGEGIYKIFKDDRVEKQDNFKLPKYFYTSQTTNDSTRTYFGTNSGCYFFDYKENTWGNINDKVNNAKLGSYVGTSIKDPKGNMWFTADEGLFRIDTVGKFNSITDSRYLPSKLLYTLNCDSHGNLIVGSNLGINYIVVNANGEVQSSKIYNAQNGFNGFETHMRSQFQENYDNIFVATIDGLYLIRAEFFTQSKPIRKPKFTSIQNNINSTSIISDKNPTFESKENSFSFTYRLINGKDNNVKYSYRLLGQSEEWSEFSTQNNHVFVNLPNGDYNFQIKASTNVLNESKVSEYRFNVSIPLYKSKVFMICILLLIITINILILSRTKKYNSKKIILSKDVDIQDKIASSLLIFGGIANTISHIAGPIIEPSLPPLIALVSLVGLILFSSGIIFRFSNYLKQRAKSVLLFGFLLIIGQNIFSVFYSNLHPFYLISIILVMMFTPFILTKLKSVLIFGLLMILTAIAVIIFIENPQYNKTLSLIAISVSACIAFFSTYLRNNSLEKLIFTSGVVNKGNVLVTAFNRKGEIAYISENFADQFDINLSETLGKSISIFNEFKPNKYSKNFTHVNLTEEFTDGKIFTTPLSSKDGTVKYFQWSCKQFSDEINVILGQDITEKINLERYYELIVTNADDLIYQCDVNGKFVFLNEKCATVTGFEVEELIGKETMSIVEPKHLANTLRFYAKQFKDGTKTTYFEFPILTKSGKVRWLGQNVSTMYKEGTDSVVEGYLALARDITEKRKSDQIIKEQNNDITASINYAKRIQYNLLPGRWKFNKAFESSFVLFKPKDIVSGDFYWIDSVEGKTIIVCADCTGHGVPGSFMTLLGINLLNQIILEDKILSPGLILDAFDYRLGEVLPRDGEEKINDGLECSVIVIDDESQTIEYGTAGSKFVHIQKDEIHVLRGDMKHIGDLNPDFGNYKTFNLPYSSEDTFYQYSDGFADQFGGERGKKFTSKRFLKFISEVRNTPFENQKVSFNDVLESWKKDYPQTDDITVIGFKVNGNISEK